MANSDDNSVDTNTIEFYSDPSSIDTKKVTCIGIKQSINAIVVEVNKEIILQTIQVESFSDSTIKPLKNQLSKLFTEFKEVERRKIINSIITCINKNIDKIYEHCKQITFNETVLFEKDIVEELIELALSSENLEYKTFTFSYIFEMETN